LTVVSSPQATSTANDDEHFVAANDGVNCLATGHAKMCTPTIQHEIQMKETKKHQHQTNQTGPGWVVHARAIYAMKESRLQMGRQEMKSAIQMRSG
jgi:hypothetical protein